MNLSRLNSGSLPVETKALAQALLGCILVRDSDEGTAAGRIVETEAYLPNDPACHAFTGKSSRNATLFGPPHLAYVYQIYGTSFCFNLSSEPEGEGAGVLVRALEPVEGVGLMQRRREAKRTLDLCRGPGRLCRALAIDRSFDGADLFSEGLLRLVRDDHPPARVGRSRRIGISRAVDHRLRFYLAGSPYLSGAAHLSPA